MNTGRNSKDPVQDHTDFRKNPHRALDATRAEFPQPDRAPPRGFQRQAERRAERVPEPGRTSCRARTRARPNPCRARSRARPNAVPGGSRTGPGTRGRRPGRTGARGAWPAARRAVTDRPFRARDVGSGTAGRT